MSKADRTKAFIVEKTAPLFNEKGFAGTSLSDISEVTGLTKGGIYANFKDKNEVAIAVFEHNWATLRHLINESMRHVPTVFEKLMVYPQVYEKILKDPVLRFGCPILNTATESDDTHPELRKCAETAMVQWRNGLKQLIEQGISQRELREDIDADDTAFIMIAMIEGSIMMSKLSGKSRDRQRTRQAIERYIKTLQSLS